MKLLAVTPLCVNDEELHRRQDRYNRLTPADVEVELHNLGTGLEIPRALSTREDIEASESAVLEWFRGADGSSLSGAVDGFLPDCVLDPVVDRVETGLSLPVFGLLKLTSYFLTGLGQTVGAVARNEPIARELDRKYASYGHGPLHEKTSILGLSVDDIADDDLWASVVDGHRQTLKSHFVINGCSAVEVRERGGRGCHCGSHCDSPECFGTGCADGAIRVLTGQPTEYRAGHIAAINELAAYAMELKYDDFPLEVTARLEVMVTDLLGVTAAGALTPEIQELLRCWHLLPGDSPLVGKTVGTIPESAAYLNAVAACCLELDEGNKHAQGHPAVHVFFAAMAATQLSDQAVTGQEFLTAVVAGYEVAARFGRALKRHTAWHPHGHWGAPGAACAAALIFGCGEPQVAAAIDASTALMHVTPWSTVLDGNFARNFWAAGANIAGINAARLAQANLTTNSGNAGQALGTIVGELTAGSLVENLGQEWLITQGYSKLHSSCSYTHAAVDLIQCLKKEHDFCGADVFSLSIRTHSLAEPLFVRYPHNRLSAMFSFPFVASAAVLNPLLSPEAMDPDSENFAQANAFSDKVSVEVWPEFDRLLPAQRWTEVSIVLHDGTSLTLAQSNPRGDVDYKPLDAEAIDLKLERLIGREKTTQIQIVAAEMSNSLDAKSTLGRLLTV